ncbi:MAG TPA: hypothetical protein GX727_03990 [Clostridium sp.]|jgi:methyl-accepting chemotaxis protein|nr:hypothetical protein [Clostridium sp.]
MRLFVDMIVNLDPVGVAIIFIILLIFVFSFAINLIVRRKYISIQNDLEKNKDNEKGEFKNNLLNMIVESYKSTALVNYNEVNTQAIIENCFNTKLRIYLVFERFIKHTVSTLITLGLLGTFFGLTLAVTDLVNVFRKIMESDAVTDPTFSTGFLNDLIPSVYSMGVAFSTSLFGIASSILFTIFNIVCSAEEARETLMVRIEEYLDNTVSLVIAKDKETEYNLMNKILKETFIEFGEKIESTLKQTVESFGESLTSVVMDVNVTSKTLDNTVEKFDSSLKNFASNIKDFTEFNNNLKNNIEKMDVSFIKVTEALTDTSKIISENYSSIENFSKDIKDAAEEMTEYNRQVIHDISNIVIEVKSTVTTINELSETIKTDLGVRTEEIKEYHDKINNLMTKLGEEVNLLGEKTAEAFSKSLDESGKIVSQKVVEGMDGILKEIFVIMDEFKENEKMLAKTIVTLPDQLLTYNETASTKINKQLDEVKRLLRNN